MNVIPPVPTPVVFNTGTVNTESVKRDNTLRETVPAVGANENSSAEKGVGSESDRVKTPGQNQQAVTYEKPNTNANGQAINDQNNAEKDNGQDQSAGKESAEERQQEQQAEQSEIRELEKRDAEVKAHEQAHATTGGQYASTPSYQYKKGPDGRSYAVDGEVSIDLSKESTPEATIRKAQQVKAAALAPAEPSPQDLRVAAEATKLVAEARKEIREEKAEEAKEALKVAIERTKGGIEALQTPSPRQLELDLEDFVGGSDISTSKRTLNNAEDFEAEAQAAQSRDLEIEKRVSVIQNFYQNVTQPQDEGLDLIA